MRRRDGTGGDDTCVASVLFELPCSVELLHGDEVAMVAVINLAHKSDKIQEVRLPLIVAIVFLRLPAKSAHVHPLPRQGLGLVLKSNFAGPSLEGGQPTGTAPPRTRVPLCSRHRCLKRVVQAPVNLTGRYY